MTFEVLVPTYDDAAKTLETTGRLSTLEGTTIGIVSNGKMGTVDFFDAMERTLLDDYGVAEVVRTTKGNYSAPAGPDIVNAAERWHALIAGIGD